MTIPAGSSASSMMRLVVSRAESFLDRSTMNAAKAMISSTLPNSDGWKVKKGSSIQRRDPRVAPPTTSTSRISESMPA